MNFIQAIKNQSGRNFSRPIKVIENTYGLVPVLVYNNFEQIRFSKKIKIPKNEILNSTNIDLDFTLINKKGQKIGKLRKKFPFSKNKILLGTTRKKPGISAAWTAPNRVAISCNQNDPNGKLIEIFYKKTFQSNWESLATMNLQYQEGAAREFILQDNFNTNLALFRAISKNKLNDYGSFYDISLPVSREILNIQNCTSGTDLTALVAPDREIVTTNKKSGVEISLNTARFSIVPGGPLPRLRKKTFKVGENNRSALLNDIQILLNWNLLFSTPSYLDRDVEDGKYYEYSILLGSQENEIQLGRSLIHYSSPPDWLTATCKPNRDNKSSYLTTFTLDAKLNETKGNHFLQFLVQNKIYNLENENIQNIKQKLSQFFLFKVTRKNLKTGLTKDLGWTSPGRFAATNSPSTPYLYTFELFVGNPDQIIKDLSTDSSSNIPYFLLQNNDNQGLNLSSSGFKPSISQGSISSSTVASQSSVNKGLYNLVSAGWKETIGVSNLYKDTGTGQPASISDITFHKIPLTGENIVEWKVSGDEEAIDHFIIFSNANSGDYSLAGAHHHKSNSGTYTFYDKRFKGAVGVVSYGVTICFSNSSISSPVYSTAKVVT